MKLTFFERKSWVNNQLTNQFSFTSNVVLGAADDYDEDNCINAIPIIGTPGTYGNWVFLNDAHSREGIWNAFVIKMLLLISKKYDL